MTIRPATPSDAPAMLALIQELATFEREPEAVKTTVGDLLRFGWGAEKHFDCLIAESDGAHPVGLALYYWNYSTWTGRPGIHLEDLYVQPDHRGQGIGKALLKRVAAIALAAGSVRLQWDVLRWNEKAVKFYEAHGAHPKDDWATMRVENQALVALAQ